MSLPTSVEKLMFFDPEFEKYASTFLAEHGSAAKTHTIKTTEDLIEAVKQYSQVRYLEVVMHGSPGMIWFNSGGQMVASYLGTIINQSKMLAPEARVLFLGCNVAEGTAGDDFLSNVGRSMFSGTGGTVGGTDVTNVILGGKSTRMNPLRFFDAKLKVRRFDANGKMVAGEDVSYWGNRTKISVP